MTAETKPKAGGMLESSAKSLIENGACNSARTAGREASAPNGRAGVPLPSSSSQPPSSQLATQLRLLTATSLLGNESPATWRR